MVFEKTSLTRRQEELRVLLFSNYNFELFCTYYNCTYSHRLKIEPISKEEIEELVCQEKPEPASNEKNSREPKAQPATHYTSEVAPVHKITPRLSESRVPDTIIVNQTITNPKANAYITFQLPYKMFYKTDQVRFDNHLISDHSITFISSRFS